MSHPYIFKVVSAIFPIISYCIIKDFNDRIRITLNFGDNIRKEFHKNRFTSLLSLYCKRNAL